MKDHNENDEHTMTEATAEIGMESTQHSAAHVVAAEDMLRANA